MLLVAIHYKTLATTIDADVEFTHDECEVSVTGNRRVGSVVGFAIGVALVITAASTAWACTGLQQSLGIAPQAGPAGTVVTVRGQAVRWVTGPATVAIHWNNLDGPAIGSVKADSTTDGDFQTQFAVPDVAPGIYTLVAVSGPAAVARVTFEVTPQLAPTSPTVAAPALSLRPGTTRPGSSAPLIAVGMLSVGAVVLTGGFASAVLRRRRLPGVSV
ncbi:MAG: hypothetical protein M3256_28165 [Actinomycetota bacterium]|nr:hypothetical protein [Actinomycetota bacterium]